VHDSVPNQQAFVPNQQASAVTTTAVHNSVPNQHAATATGAPLQQEQQQQGVTAPAVQVPQAPREDAAAAAAAAAAAGASAEAALQSFADHPMHSAIPAEVVRQRGQQRAGVCGYWQSTSVLWVFWCTV